MRMVIATVNGASFQRDLFRSSITEHTVAHTLMLLVAILSLANEHVKAQSFFPIDVQNPSTRLAAPFDVSSNGSRIGGAILYYNIDIDCGGLRCTAPFTWSASGGINTQSYA